MRRAAALILVGLLAVRCDARKSRKEHGQEGVSAALGMCAKGFVDPDKTGVLRPFVRQVRRGGLLQAAGRAQAVLWQGDPEGREGLRRRRGRRVRSRTRHKAP